MKSVKAVKVLLLFTLALGGCVTHSTSSRMWGAPPAPQPEWARPGYVEWIREVVHREEGNPAGGALAGAIIGGLLFGSDAPSAIFGAAAGATVGAVASQGSAESRTYEVAVRFDDGGFQTFVYGGYSPFQAGEPVLMTPRGLTRR